MYKIGDTMTGSLNIYGPLYERPVINGSYNIFSSSATADYNMGYKFTVNANGYITKLWARVGSAGTYTVRLYDSTGAVLASGNITLVANTWEFVGIGPISVTSGNWYVVAIRSGAGTFVYELFNTPQTFGNITINEGRYDAATDNIPTSVQTTQFYGVDITYYATSSAPADRATINEDGTINLRSGGVLAGTFQPPGGGSQDFGVRGV